MNLPASLAQKFVLDKYFLNKSLFIIILFYFFILGENTSFPYQMFLEVWSGCHYHNSQYSIPVLLASFLMCKFGVCSPPSSSPLSHRSQASHRRCTFCSATSYYKFHRGLPMPRDVWGKLNKIGRLGEEELQFWELKFTAREWQNLLFEL